VNSSLGSHSFTRHPHVHYWPAWCASIALHAVVCRRRLSSSVTHVGGRPPPGRARGRSGSRHCTVGQYVYGPLGRHLVHKWNESYLILVRSRRVSPHFGQYSFSVPMREGGWVGLGGWLHTGRKMIMHPSTKRARRRVTSLMRLSPLPLRQTTAIDVIANEAYMTRTCLLAVGVYSNHLY